MSGIEKYGNGKLAKIVDNLEFENDFGQELLGLGHITKDRGVIAVGSLIGLFLGTSVINLPFGVLIAALGVNDWIALNRMPQQDQVAETLGSPVEEVEQVEPEESATPSLQPQIFKAQPTNPVHLPVLTEEIEFNQEIPNLPLKLAQDMKNTLIVGVPGSGKGLFVSNALAHVIERGDTSVFYIDPKNDPKESGYFQGRVHKLFRLPRGIISADPIFVYDWLQKCFSTFHAFDAANGRKLLVLDEMTSLIKKLANVPVRITGTVKGDKWLEEEIVTCSAAGDSAGATIWGIAQNGHNSGLGMDGGAKSQMTPIAIISLKQLTASQALLRASFVPSDKRLSSEEVKAICESSEVGRAIFHGGLNDWYPMPALPNPSGYNRDNREFIDGFTPVQDIASTPQAEPTPTEYSEEEKRQAQAQMVASLRATSYHTLWEFVRDELGVEDSEQIKETLEAIASLVFEKNLTSLKDKFHLQSPLDVRYSYSGYSKKVAQTHRYSNNRCCCCLTKPSEQVHHSRYEGLNDEPNINLFPVCLSCHKSVCHSKDKWVQLGTWRSRNTPEWEAKLKAGFEMLSRVRED